MISSKLAAPRNWFLPFAAVSLLFVVAPAAHAQVPQAQTGGSGQSDADTPPPAPADDNATDACLRLMELGETARDWPAVEHYAERFLAVNPLVAPPYRHLARAARERGERDRAIAANRTLLLLDPANPAEIHFQLARLLHEAGDPEARRQVLQALEDAPRNRDALALLLDLDRESPGAPGPSSPP